MTEETKLLLAKRVFDYVHSNLNGIFFSFRCCDSEGYIEPLGVVSFEENNYKAFAKDIIDNKKFMYFYHKHLDAFYKNQLKLLTFLENNN